MCWWNWKAVCTCVAFVLFVGSGSSRGEVIRSLDQPSQKKAVKAKSEAFSLRAMGMADDSDVDRSARFLLGGKKEQPAVHLPSSKKKLIEPPILLEDKHPRKLKLKGVKVPPHKPLHGEPTPPSPVQWAVAPTPMAPSALELPMSVPAPKSWWAGMCMMAALGVWKWTVGRRVRA